MENIDLLTNRQFDSEVSTEKLIEKFNEFINRMVIETDVIPVREIEKLNLSDEIRQIFEYYLTNYYGFTINYSYNDLNSNNLETLNSVELFLQDIKEIPLLSEEEQIELFRKYNKEKKELLKKEYKDEIITHNLRLVVDVVKKYLYKGLPVADLIQEGCLGLIKAVEKYDVNRGYKFSTYAVIWIKQTIGRAISQKSRMIRIPVHMTTFINKIKAYKDDYFAKNNCYPSVKEIADILGKTEKEIKYIKLVSSGHLSIENEYILKNEVPLIIKESLIDRDYKYYPEEKTEYNELKKVIFNALDDLTNDEKKVILSKFELLDDKTRPYEEVIKDFPSSRQAGAVKLRALKNLRKTKLKAYENY